MSSSNPPGVDYAFSNRAADAATQLNALARYLDPITTSVLRQTGIQPGQRVLELGPGGGSVAYWLAGRIGPTGRILAIDQDPSKLHPTPNMRIHRHNLQYGLPETAAGPFHLIHARLVLVHLPNRRELLAQLVNALAPGGWLVLGEFSDHPLKVLTAAHPDHAALFTRVIDTFTDLLTTQHGADISWAGQLHTVMAGAGLQHLATIEHAQSWTGGQPGCQLHRANISQTRDRLTAAGLTNTEIDQFLQLMNDPTFATRSWQFICTRGRKPSGNRVPS